MRGENGFMVTECNAIQMEFQGFGRRRTVVDFDAGHVTSDAGAVLLREADARLGLSARFAQCFTDYRDARFVEHSVESLVRQRVMGLCLGYEDLNDQDALRADPLVALACGKPDVEGKQRARERDKGRPLAGASTLDRLEITPEAVDWSDAKRRYYKIVHEPERIESFFVDVFLQSYTHAPEEIVLDFDPTDITLHGEQEGRFFHGYYGDYCYLPMYVFCGEHVLAARLRTAKHDASDGALELLQQLLGQIRQAWPHTRIVVRADSGFAREPLMRYCEQTPNLFYVFGLAKNERLKRRVRRHLHEAKTRFEQSGHDARVYTEFRYRTRDSWSRARRVVAKAQWLAKGPNPRFVVTNLPGHELPSQPLYEEVYCARGEMENHIKEQQLDLFAGRASSHFFRANQLRLWFSALAYTLMYALRRIALPKTRLAKATSHTIRTRLLKLGARVRVSARRMLIQIASACPAKPDFINAWKALRAYPLRL